MKLTKLELAAVLHDVSLTKTLPDVADKTTKKISQYVNDLRDTVELLTSKLVGQGFSQLANLSLPILNRITVHKLSFITAVKSLNRTDFNLLMESFEDDFQESFVQLLEMNYHEFVEVISRNSIDMSDMIVQLTQKIRKLQDDLNKYKESAAMDAVFYMWVRFFL